MSETNSKSENKRIGWYVEVDSELYHEFCRLFPHRGAKAALTIAAIKHAIRVGPAALAKLYDVSEGGD